MKSYTYGNIIEINKFILNEAEYNLELDLMKAEWKTTSIAKKAYIFGMCKLPDKFRNWIFTKYNTPLEPTGE